MTRRHPPTAVRLNVPDFRLLGTPEDKRKARASLGWSLWECLNCKDRWQAALMPDRCGSCCCSSFARVSDSDGNPKGGDVKQAPSRSDDSAGLQGIAKP